MAQWIMILKLLALHIYIIIHIYLSTYLKVLSLQFCYMSQEYNKNRCTSFSLMKKFLALRLRLLNQKNRCIAAQKHSMQNYNSVKMPVFVSVFHIHLSALSAALQSWHFSTPRVWLVENRAIHFCHNTSRPFVQPGSDESMTLLWQ